MIAAWQDRGILFVYSDPFLYRIEVNNLRFYGEVVYLLQQGDSAIAHEN